ncbi:MAG: LysM peptidoglycan-binding domain-containing protein [Lachnospiraceae bacterium]|nr:LysM peptidoglycan-binding domain-containing protein [Lachnospiraceae bacterium]
MLTHKITNNNIMLISLLVITIILSLTIGFRMVHANESVEYEKSFVSIEIESGDTLTSIAQAYAPSSAVYADYIVEVKNINNLQNDTIHAGCYLMIPVYTIIE